MNRQQAKILPRFAALFLLGATTIAASGQSFDFTGGGDGVSWHDDSNWRFGNAPSESGRATIQGSSNLNFDVRLGGPTVCRSLNVRSSTLNVDAPLNVDGEIILGGNEDWGFGVLEVTDDVTAERIVASNYSNIDFRSGVMTADFLTIRIGTFLPVGGSFSRSGATNFLDVGSLGVESTGMTVYGRDTVGQISVRDTRLRVFGNHQLAAFAASEGSSVLVRGNLVVDNGFSVASGSKVTLSRGTVESSVFGINHGADEQAVVVEQVGGHFSTGSLQVIGETEVTVTPDDFVANSLVANFGATINVERPLNLSTVLVSGGDINVDQSDGETIGLALETLPGLGGNLHIQFDDVASDDLDWGLRVNGNQVNLLQQLIADGSLTFGGGTSVPELIYDVDRYGPYTYLAIAGPLGEASLNNGILTVTGTTGPDEIMLTHNGSTASVQLNGQASQEFADVTRVIVDGGLGDDIIVAEYPVLTIRGGSGNDMLTALGNGKSRIIAGSGDDICVGGEGNDIIYGQAGMDEIRGQGGNDRLDGGPGLDQIEGGEGNDFIRGGVDRDTIKGGPGNDRLFGDAGSDRILGDAGRDTIFGGTGDDVIVGGNDDDTIRGNQGDDRLLGGSGNDGIFGDDGDDALFGGSGNDIMRGGGGNDTFRGDSGSDRFIGGTGTNTASDVE